MALLANLLAQLGIVVIGAGFGAVLLWPGTAGVVVLLVATTLGLALELGSALVERYHRPA